MDVYGGNEMAAYGFGGVLFLIFYLAILGFSIWMMVLMIKLALRGIKALDNYNSTFEKRNYE